MTSAFTCTMRVPDGFTSTVTDMVPFLPVAVTAEIRSTSARGCFAVDLAAGMVG